MRLQLTDKASTVALVLTLCRQFRSHSVELRQLCNGAKSGIQVDLTRIKDYTRSQENFYRQKSREFADWTGLTEEELHDEILRRTFGSIEVETKLGRRQRPAKTSKDLDKTQFNQLIDTLISTATKLKFSLKQ